MCHRPQCMSDSLAASLTRVMQCSAPSSGQWHKVNGAVQAVYFQCLQQVDVQVARSQEAVNAKLHMLEMHQKETHDSLLQMERTAISMYQVCIRFIHLSLRYITCHRQHHVQASGTTHLGSQAAWTRRCQCSSVLLYCSCAVAACAFTCLTPPQNTPTPNLPPALPLPLPPLGLYRIPVRSHDKARHACRCALLLQ